MYDITFISFLQSMSCLFLIRVFICFESNKYHRIGTYTCNKEIRWTIILTQIRRLSEADTKVSLNMRSDAFDVKEAKYVQKHIKYQTVHALTSLYFCRDVDISHLRSVFFIKITPSLLLIFSAIEHWQVRYTMKRN